MPRTKRPAHTKSTRTKFPSGASIVEDGYLLPETLGRGTLMKSSSEEPCLFTTIKTSRRNDFGEVLYRLKFKAQPFKGYKLPAITSPTLWSRDQLQESGARIVE